MSWFILQNKRIRLKTVFYIFFFRKERVIETETEIGTWILGMRFTSMGMKKGSMARETKKILKRMTSMNTTVLIMMRKKRFVFRTFSKFKAIQFPDFFFFLQNLSKGWKKIAETPEYNYLRIISGKKNWSGRRESDETTAIYCVATWKQHNRRWLKWLDTFTGTGKGFKIKNDQVIHWITDFFQYLR